ncbi:hypothetical protein [Azospirillum sp. B4]|uniref:hypothetical protein n=1 Tax=Azospirillum sp. B4 TaxID=95605 RepID=UPI0005CB7B21|nr:hypothetical protein [Azospirillum sp. B4]
MSVSQRTRRSPRALVTWQQQAIIDVTNGRSLPSEKLGGQGIHYDWFFAIMARGGKRADIRDYVETRALVQASQSRLSGLA